MIWGEDTDFWKHPYFFVGGELYERWGGEEIVELVMYFFV